MSVFTVTGTTKYGQVLLKTDTLLFQTNSKLVFAPTEKAVPGQKSFTIVAGEIQITDQAQITYDLDGRPGIDPDTPAPLMPGKATDGSGGSSLSTDGPYPRAADGGPGQPGTTGAAGYAGIDAPSLEIFVVKVNSSDMEINFKGQDGGKGQAGGDGGPGGNGQKGAASTASDSWYDGDECTREPGRGGNGGKGGDAGYPGTGGKGGNGGIV
jgi:hypothetical protein